MYEVRVNWTIPSGVATQSIMYFDGSGTVGAARARVRGALNAGAGALANGVKAEVAEIVRVLDPANGALLGEETGGGALSPVTGAGSGLAVADATQVLLSWTTGVVVGRRFLQGRTFIPGLDANLLSGGNLGSSGLSTWNSVASAFVSPPAGFGVWHRPKGGSGGSFHVATAGAARSELAVLRRRRNR